MTAVEHHRGASASGRELGEPGMELRAAEVAVRPLVEATAVGGHEHVLPTVAAMLSMRCSPAGTVPAEMEVHHVAVLGPFEQGLHGVEHLGAGRLSVDQHLDVVVGELEPMACDPRHLESVIDAASEARARW